MKRALICTLGGLLVGGVLGAGLTWWLSQPNDDAPFCRIMTYRGHGGVQYWRLEYRRLKEITVRLVVMRDGKVEASSASTWIRAAKEGGGQVTFLEADGVPMPEAGWKTGRVLGINMYMSTCAELLEGRSALYRWDNLVLRKQEGGQDLASQYLEPLPRKTVLLSQLWSQAEDKDAAEVRVKLPVDLESLIELSKSGRTVVAITLEWEPE